MFGEWRIRVIAQGQVEENTFIIEEYYQTRFEVNVTMAPFIFTTDYFLEGTVMANYTGGAPVTGNLTLKATVRQHRTSNMNTNLYLKDLPPISERYFFFVSTVHDLESPAPPGGRYKIASYLFFRMNPFLSGIRSRRKKIYDRFLI